MVEVHPSAIVAEGAVLGRNVRIGPYCVVGPQVRLEDDVVLEAHVVAAGRTTLGAGCHVFPFASLGQPPQDLKYAGEDSALVIGPHVVLREHVTVNPGTRGGGMATRIGAGSVLMVGAHVAHDCQLGAHVILVNNASLGGHVEIGDHAIVGGLAAVHQFVRIGRHAMVGGMSALDQDLIPFGVAQGNRAWLAGLNLIGLRRRGFSREHIHALRRAYRLLFADHGTLRQRSAEVAASLGDWPEVRELVDFVRAPSRRALCLPRRER
jgi:UDP-N-acetylglucosamine acyltransferase